MKIRLLLAILASGLTLSLRADAIDLSAHAGYTTVGMGSFNKYNEKFWGYDSSGGVSDITNGYVVGLDASTHRLTGPWLALGLRGEYLQTNEAQLNDTASTIYFNNMGTLSSLLIGAKIDATGGPLGLDLGLGAWIGGGYGTMGQFNAMSHSGPVQSGVYSGTCLQGEFEASVGYHLSPRIGFQFTGGWRWADFTSLSDGGQPLYEQGPYNGIYSPQKALNPVNVDFSGATAQGSVNLSF
jgi:hypothetical protein